MSDSSVVRTLFLAIVAEVIGFGIVLPIIPVILTEPSSPYFLLPAGFTVDQGFILVGLLIGAYPVAQFFSTPILGEISDIHGRRTVISVSILGTVIASLIFGYGILVKDLWLLFASRAVNGLTGGLISVAQATVADVTDAGTRSESFGVIGAAFGIGFIIGPFIGGVLSSDISPFFSPATPFWFAAALSLASLAYVLLRLEETSPMEDRRVNWFKPVSQLRRGLALPGLRTLFGANFFYFSGFAFFTTFAPVFLVERFGFDQFQTGTFFLYIGVLAIFGQIVLVRYVFRRVEEERFIPHLLFLTGLFIFLQPLQPALTPFLIVVALFSFSNGLARVALNTVVSQRAGEEHQGLALGTNQSLRALGTAIPSALSGLSAALFFAAMPLYIAGAVIMLTAAGYAALRGRGH
ncbi:MAG: MFS transporter [Candidatus Nanohaloarchaea archaeon]|nr:MFS transporter [Candidatus Nanohaloarchaea archaeon]